MYRRTKSAWATLSLAVVFAGCGSSSSNTPGSGATPAPAGGSASDAGGGGNQVEASGPSIGPGNTPAPSNDASVTPGPFDAGAALDSPSSVHDGAPPAPTDTGAMGGGDASMGGGGPMDAGPPAVRFVGRVDRTNPAAPKFAWEGTTILARFTGPSIGVRMSGASGTTYFDVSIDGVMQTAPLVVSTAAQSYPLASNLAAGPHEVTVYRRNEPMIGGDTTFMGLVLDDAGALLPPSLPSARRIEIVGDSVTSGFGDQSMGGACPNSASAQDYDVAYGAVAARAVQADLITIAWTAKGMYRNNDTTTTNTMPIYYGRTLPDTQTTDTWDFTSWIPDAVVIYLGNNDYGRGDPGPMYVTTYNTFIARVRKNYPNALIVCTIGPNLADPSLSLERTAVKGIVAAANAAGDMKVDFLEMPQPTAAEGTGCGGHPLASTHARMGAALVAELKTKLGW